MQRRELIQCSFEKLAHNVLVGEKNPCFVSSTKLLGIENCIKSFLNEKDSQNSQNPELLSRFQTFLTMSVILRQINPVCT